MKQVQVLLLVSVCGYILISAASGSASGSSPNPKPTPAILSGYCGSTATMGPGGFFLYGLGQVAASDCGGSNAQDGLPIPSPGKLKNLRVVDLGSGGEIISVLVNGVSSSISCVIDLNTKVCSDTVHTAAVTAGDLVAVQVTLATAQFASQLRVTMEKQ